MSTIKKGYKRLLIFELLIIFLLLISTYLLNITKYELIMFLIITLIIFKKNFGTEKDNNRYTKYIIYELIIILGTFFIVYYISGIFLHFIKNNNYLTIYGFKNFIIPTILIIIIKEYLRYNILKKSEGSKLLVNISLLLFILIDISMISSIKTFTSIYTTFMFIALNLFPSIAKNITSTYIATKVGYKPNIIWLLILDLHSYIFPIIPNINNYTYSIVFILLPLTIGFFTYKFFEKDNITKDIIIPKKTESITISIISLILLAIIYLNSGYFTYYTITIGSGSMNPSLQVGDIIITKKTNNYNSFKIGDILVYKHGNAVVVHRITKIIKEEQYYFYTKGDANETIDNYVIEEKDIIGLGKYKIPYLGYPSIFLKNL